MRTLLLGAYRLWKRFTGWPRAAALEAGFMFANDLFFLFVWFIFVSKNAVAGWGISEALLFLGAATAGFGIAHILFGGAWNLDKIIDGSFDAYFLRPRSVWLQYMTDGSSLSVLGDLFFGLLLLALCPYSLISKLFVTLSMIYVQLGLATAMAGLVMILNAINTDAFRRLWDIAFLQAIWPSHAMRDEFLRLIFIFILPGLLYVTLPIEVLRGEAPWHLLLAGYAVWAAIPAILWKAGMRRYTGTSGYGWVAQ